MTNSFEISVCLCTWQEGLIPSHAVKKLNQSYQSTNFCIKTLIKLSQIQKSMHKCCTKTTIFIRPKNYRFTKTFLQ